MLDMVRHRKNLGIAYNRAECGISLDSDGALTSARNAALDSGPTQIVIGATSQNT